MPLTFTKVAAHIPERGGGLKMVIYDITFDNAYAAGGWAIAGSDVGLNSILNLQTPGAIDGFVLGWKQSTGKLMAFEEADGGGALQEIDATDLNAKVVRSTIWGS